DLVPTGSLNRLREDRWRRFHRGVQSQSTPSPQHQMTSDLLRLCRSFVAMMQAAEPRTCSHSPRACRSLAAERSSLAQSKMSSVFVVIAEVLGQEALQMRFVKRDHMVQKVTPAALDPSLRDSVLPRTLQGGSDWHQTHRANGHGDFQTELGVAIKDQE